MKDETQIVAPDAASAVPLPDLAAMREAAETAARLMKVLSNPDRLMLMCQLAGGEMRVGELEQRVGVAQPTLSQQLGVLRDEGLVDTRRDGKAIYYRIDSPQALAVLTVLYEQFCNNGNTSSKEGPAA